MLIATRPRTTTAAAVAGVLAVVMAVALAVTYLTFKKDAPTANPNVAEITIDRGDSLRVSFIGDSIDAGFYATEENLGFHALMVDEWRKTGPVADFPMADLIGGTANDVLQNPELPADQQLYVVELGTNDAARVDYHQFRNEYSTLLDRIRSASRDAALVCIGVWRPKTNGDRFDLIIKDQCEIRGGVFVGISDLAADTSLKGPAGVETFGGVSDDFHPNDLGHRMIADRVLGAIRVHRQG